MYKTIPLSILALLISSFCNAQEIASAANENIPYTVNDTVKNKKGEVLQEVIITANQQKNHMSNVKLDIKPMDLPQSIQIVGKDLIEQQQTIRLSDVIKNVNGVYVSSARGGAQESFYSRGYDMSANNMLKNGFRLNSGSMPEVASLEQVEVLKGSAALLFGNVAAGGILNMVTKTPSFTKGGEIGMQIGSYSFYKPSVDIYGPLNKIIAYRFVGSYENSESFRDVVKKERIYFNPSVLFKANSKTEILLQGDYLLDNWTPDFGTGAIGKEVADVPRNTYLGAEWSNGQTKQASVSAALNHQFNTNWKLNFNASFQNYSRTSEGTERIQPLANGDLNRPIGKNNALDQIIGEQISISGNFTTGKIKHQLITGIDLENSFTQAYTYTFTPAIYDMINIFNLNQYPQRTDIPQPTTTKIVKVDTDRFGVYAQDLISIAEKFKVLAGIRWSWQEAETLPDTKRIDQAFSPKIGLIFQPNKDMSIFASYSNSFTPNTGFTVDNESIKPSIIDQYEAGIKKDFWRGILSTNITLYQITNSNLAQTAEFKADGVTPNSDTTLKVLSGETVSKGVEIDIIAKPVAGLNITAGYSYNDMRYTKTSGTVGSFIEGDRLVRTPANTANLSFFYKLPSGILKGLSFGSLANYIGDRVGGWNKDIVVSGTPAVTTIRDREIPLEGYTTIDVSAGYEWKKFSILCKLSNVTNELNYTVHENYSVNPIAPRQVMTSLKYKF